MKSISLLTLLVFTLIGTAYADVTITATDAGGGKLLIGYQTTGAIAPVAFALDIQLSNGATFSSVTPLTQRFGYYPSRFRDYINPLNPNWEDPQYTPITAWNEPAALGGLGTSGVTIEMASMLDPYLASGSAADFTQDGFVDLRDSAMLSMDWLSDAGMSDLDGDGLVNFRDYALFMDGHFSPIPALSGDLLLLQLNGNGAGMTMANISLNLMRGGVVLEDAANALTSLPGQVTVIVPEPATLLLFGLASLALRRKH